MSWNSDERRTCLKPRKRSNRQSQQLFDLLHPLLVTPEAPLVRHLFLYPAIQAALDGEAIATEASLVLMTPSCTIFSGLNACWANTSVLEPGGESW